MGEFDSFDKSSEHFDQCHPGLSLEEGNAFPPLKRRSLEEGSEARAPYRKAEQLDQSLETQPQPGPSGLSNRSDGSSFKEPKSGSIGKAKKLKCTICNWTTWYPDQYKAHLEICIIKNISP